MPSITIKPRGNICNLDCKYCYLELRFFQSIAGFAAVDLSQIVHGTDSGWAGFVKYRNPFSGQIYQVALKPEDVACIVFWSKNYKPLLP